MRKKDLSTIRCTAMQNIIFKTIFLLFLCSLVFTPVNTYFAKNKEIIKLNKTSLTLTPGKTYSFKVTLYGGSGSIKWSSSNSSIASIKNGKVTAKKAGSTTIKAKYSGKTAQCKITVKSPNQKKKKIYGVFCNHVKSIKKKNGKITIQSDEIYDAKTFDSNRKVLKKKKLSFKYASKVKYAEYTYGMYGKDQFVEKMTFEQLKQGLYYDVEGDDSGIMKVYVVGGKITEIRVFYS